MFGFGKDKKKDGSANPVVPSTPDLNNGKQIKIGTVPSGASTEQLDQIAANKQKIPSLYRLLAEHKLTEKDIWEGDPILFSIIYQFKEQLNRTESPPNIITFHLPSMPEFNDIKKKSYKINKKFTIAQTINLICKKQSIPDPKRFWIGSLQGFIMNENETLASYGLGTLFESWELRLYSKEEILSKSPMRSTNIESLEKEFIVVFELPPLEQFNGLKRHNVKVDSTITIKQAISNICKKYRVEQPERFSAMTMDDNPLVEFVLFGGAQFKHYGLGYKFRKWDLKIVFNDLIPPFVHRHTVIPMHGWTQVSPGQLDPFTARGIINELEEKCTEYQCEITRLQQEIEGGNEVNATHIKEIERLREELEKLQKTLEEERDQTFKQNEIYEKRIMDANSENDSQSQQLKQMKAQLDQVTQSLSQLRLAHDDQTNALSLMKAEKDELQSQLQDSQAEFYTLQEKMSSLKMSSATTETNLHQMIATLEKEKIAIKEECKLTVEQLSTTMATTENASKTLVANQAVLVTQLQDDISNLKRDKEIMNLNVQKATLEKQEAIVIAEKAEKKALEAQTSVKRVERQFGDLERERDVLRQQVQIKVDEIQDVQKDLEWSRETIADLERRLTTLSGDAKMFKDIKDKELEKVKKSGAEELKSKNELEQEKQRSHATQTRLNKRIAELEQNQKIQEVALKNQEASFKKQETQLKSQTEDYREKYEQLRQGIINGTVKDAASIEALPSLYNIASSPVLLNGSSGGSIKNRKSESFEGQPIKDFTVVADGLYNSLQSRFKKTDTNNVEDLEEDDN
ncbi:hypothetical protein DLAC_01285 [Tieghemostelium lacteum]|uniref:Uncharacterized protein n=1 Tax=Tieghemostelium lacteum TaxID=361077 RepID=A0A152A8A7_TIELA|nr:hypothetical protein DLAC_01285 [Tieghemostelium lacteum]|eukprot:KYR02446.1 hypothetical protein DLAC_01285 [Tieghemostelium lacteum]